MNRIEREKLHREISKIVVDGVDGIWYESCSCVNSKHIDFTANELISFISRKVGYKVKKEDIKQALNELEHADGIYYIPLKN